MGEDRVIEIEGLYTRFGSHEIHQDISLSVYRGEVLTLVGGSGSGKTTLLRQMLGLETPVQGNIKIFGYSRYDCNLELLRSLRNRSGVLFQQGALFSALTVYDNIALPMRELHCLDDEMIRDLVMLKLDMVDVDPQHANKRPAELSGGMIKRVALARALALDPELLFLDEPTAGLDPGLSESFVELIQTLRQELTLTIVMVTHDLDTLAAISSRIAVLADQRLVGLGQLQEIIRIDHPFIKDFFLGERGRNALRHLVPPS
ncbi:MAG TPA: ABC transporter ATP-binding protein [Nitrosomonas nitrosa]|nr:ATP-binding cassette domain-containing protein [Nitrosomonas nitrosa]MCO6433740.1 ATP-binding cassette domain-containing protein [Nitrosomonas nitrosa]HBZ31209.1 ABC transporter ATP-binding protein [Nitrosomonas nitrosa]HNP52178.1 ATP-binding cassette domain-containing protein [Nitrosomonas nitrosa]